MRQPFLHDLTCVIAAPTQCWSAHDGQVRPVGAQGVFYGDDRVVSAIAFEVPGREVVCDSRYEPGGGVADFHYIVRAPEHGAEPLITIVRRRQVSGEGLSESITLTNAMLEPWAASLVISITPDCTTMEQMRQGLRADSPRLTSSTWQWRDETTTAVLDSGSAELTVADTVTLRWQVSVPPRGSVEVGWGLQLADTASPFITPTAPLLSLPPTGGMQAHPSGAVERLLQVALADLNGLSMADRHAPHDAFLAAGAPWFFTLFGRDSLIAARLALPWAVPLAASTLRVLARRQGTEVDVDSAAQPGKILHEVRRVALHLGDGTVLAPEYYGTIDATCLWISLFGDLHQLGMDEADGVSLLPHLRRALGWLRDYADSDGDGFIEYLDESGHGLTNQGWKDSPDSMRFRDGSIAEGTVALAEVQGYAYAAAMAGATILTDLGDDADRAEALWWTNWAAELKTRFREAFWCTDELGRYPALALVPDAHGEGKVQVDAVASNMGHLLGTGLLNLEETSDVVARLMHPTMFSGYGIRTLSSSNPAYWPISYHCGSVWSHDTAIAIDGMLREGYVDQARTVAAGLLRVGIGFDSRLPELCSGDDESQVFPPRPYPSACRPQAWAAASSIVVARALGAI